MASLKFNKNKIIYKNEYHSNHNKLKQDETEVYSHLFSTGNNNLDTEQQKLLKLISIKTN